MIIILLLASFLLHILTFALIRTMKEKVNNFEEIDRKQKQNIKELEDLLAVYLLEIREENEKFMESIQQNESSESTFNKRERNNVKTKETYNVNREDIFQKRQEKVKKEESNPVLKYQEKVEETIQEKSNPDYADYLPPYENMNQDTVEQTLNSKVLALYDQGNSIDDIARKLDCGKTEVELMLKFHRKNS